MFYFTRTVDLPEGSEVEVDFMADDDGNINFYGESGLPDGIVEDCAWDDAWQWWHDHGWDEALQAEADDAADAKYERMREERE
jgi:hypothetical protein